MEYLLFIVGFFLLIFGAEWLIEGASKLATKLGVSPLIVGLTVVAFGTSLPELMVSLFSVLNDAATLAISNILGSNIANTLLILGITAVITPVYVHRAVVWREVVFNIVASVLLLFLVIGGSAFDNSLSTGLARVDGLILVSYFVFFLIYTFRKHHLHALIAKKKRKKQDTGNILYLLMQIVLGSAFLVLGGRWIVDGALEISSFLGVNEGFIGLTIVAFGTSLPELAASISAVRKKEVDIAVGNVVGSNLFNILWVLGLTAIIKPIEFDSIEVVNTALVALASITLFTFLVLGRHKHQISRDEGLALLTFYAFYLVILYYLLATV